MIYSEVKSERSMPNPFVARPYTGKTAFEQWVEYEGVPMTRDFYIPDINSVELAAWDRMGATGRWLVLGAPEDQLSMAAYLCEIGPGASTKPQRHLFEEIVFVWRGSGATTVWYEKEKPLSFEWKRGSLFSPPLNTWYQHFNGSGSEPVRYLALTNAPAIFNTFHSHEFIMDNPFRFRERFDGNPEYFAGKGETHPGDVWESNFIPDIVDLSLYEFPTMAAGNKHVEIELASNTLSCHIAEPPLGGYAKAHRHGHGAYILTLRGKGYTLMWPEGQKWKRFDWQPGSLISPPNRWFHQHFNLGREPIRQLALKGWGQKYPIGGWDQMFKSTEAGGDMIEYQDEDPAIRETYIRELKKEGIELKMPPMATKKV